MNTYAVVDPAGVVINIIVADPDFEIPGMSLVESSEGAAIGGSYADGVFTPPEPEPAPVPDRVTARQFKLQLLSAGLLDQVEAWIASQSQAVQIAYANSGTFVRDEPMMQAGFAALDFTGAQIDAFFTAAAAL